MNNIIFTNSNIFIADFQLITFLSLSDNISSTSRTSQEELRYSNKTQLVESSFNNYSRRTINIYDDILVDGSIHTILKSHIALIFYVVIIVVTIVLILTRSFLFYNLAIKSSRNIHAKMFHCLLEAPMKFFDTNPCGRILNRFSKDMGSIDEIMPRKLLEAVRVRVDVKHYFVVYMLLINTHNVKSLGITENNN